MANIMDYMDWRGDLSFEADEFNEVDNLILAQLAYVDFEGIVTAEENEPAVPLKEASGQFWEKNDKDEILARVSMTKSAPFVMEKMAETKRFSDVKLRCYVNEIRDEEQFQFSAVCVNCRMTACMWHFVERTTRSRAGGKILIWVICQKRRDSSGQWNI